MSNTIGSILGVNLKKQPNEKLFDQLEIVVRAIKYLKVVLFLLLNS